MAQELKRTTKPASLCPICGKPTAAQKPFCSKRCADIDLHRWLNGAYVIAGETIDDETLSSPMGDSVLRDAGR